MKMSRFLFLGIFLALAAASPAGAQWLQLNAPTQVYTPLGQQQIAAGGLATATGLPSIPAGARIAVVCVEAQAVRWRDDGVAPTASVGMPIAVGQCLVYTGSSLAALQMIQATAGAIADVAYYR